MIEDIRILADDLSGALDAAVCFAGGPKALPVTRALSRSDAFACSTGARDLSADAASEAFARNLPWLLSAGRPFHKIDSRLRGRAAREIAAIRDAAPGRPVIVASALPSQGRIVRSGRVLSREEAGSGWSVEPTDLGRDLRCLGHDPTMRPNGAADVPPGIGIFDAETDSDLDRIAACALGRPDAILCGSSGLAAALARQMKLPTPRHWTTFDRPMLMVVGTAHPRTRLQVDRLRALDPLIVHRISTDEPAFGDVASALGQGRGQLIEPLLPSAEPDGIPVRVGRWLREAAIALPRPGSLFATGGETLDRLAESLSAEGLALVGHFAEGIPVSRFLGGRWDGLTVVSKSGGFGSDDLLGRLMFERF